MTLVNKMATMALVAATALLAGCDDYSEYSEVYERMPRDDGRDCMAVCESIVESSRDEDVLACEDVRTTDGVPAVVCIFEYYDPPKLTG